MGFLKTDRKCQGPSWLISIIATFIWIAINDNHCWNSTWIGRDIKPRPVIKSIFQTLYSFFFQFPSPSHQGIEQFFYLLFGFLIHQLAVRIEFILGVHATYSWAKKGGKIGWHFWLMWTWLMWTLIYPLDRSQDSTAILQADSLTACPDGFIVDKILSTLSITQS